MPRHGNGNDSGDDEYREHGGRAGDHPDDDHRSDSALAEEPLASGRRRSKRLQRRYDNVSSTAATTHLPSRSRDTEGALQPMEVDTAPLLRRPLIARGACTPLQVALHAFTEANAILTARRKDELEIIGMEERAKEKERQRVEHDKDHNIWDEDQMFGFGERSELEPEEMYESDESDNVSLAGSGEYATTREADVVREENIDANEENGTSEQQHDRDGSDEYLPE